VIFRIPTPLFGLGLVGNTPDSILQANLAAPRAARSQAGIGGRFNTAANDGTIARFGWKTQNKSLLVFASEAYNVEIGVANELFPNERSAVPGCIFNATPEDSSNIRNPFSASQSPLGALLEMSSDIVNIAAFSRLSSPPAPASPTASTQRGANLFNDAGCALCHSTSLTTAASVFTGMGGVTFHPFSDFALHHMGLADGITQGLAGPDEFRTAPLWGAGQRLYFPHDGRTFDILEAILAHASAGSEANAVIRNFQGLSPKAKAGFA